jgi:pimeloyl-ACP methyl ester carboxylesterase
MVLPGSPAESSVRLAAVPTDLRQLAEHDARPRSFPGVVGPLAALDAGPADAGTAALLVAGFTGSKEDFAPLLAPLAAAGVRVVALDQRGQYESPGPDDTAAYSVTSLAADVLAVARTLSQEGARLLHLVGHSFGGLVARAAVVADPAPFASLTLLGSGPGGLTGRRAELLAHLRPLLEAGGVPLVHQTLEELAMTDPQARQVPQLTREFLGRRFLRNSPAGLLGMADALLGEPDRVAELAASGVPLLVAHGEADDAWPPSVQADMARRLGARHRVISGSIHSPAVENPTATVDVLLDFWSQIEGRPAPDGVGVPS